MIVLTVAGAYISEIQMASRWVPIAIVMLLVCLKFMMVVLEYMEMRKSNRAWKINAGTDLLLFEVMNCRRHNKATC